MPEAVEKLRKKAAHSRADGQACFYKDFGREDTKHQLDNFSKYHLYDYSTYSYFNQRN
jgi:hypothetical protein